MSLNYWQRKYNGCYVYVPSESEFRKIQDIFPKDGKTAEGYPEETAKKIEFDVGLPDRIGRDDFDVRFPAERYAFVNGHLVWGKRTMKRAWMMAPCAESYSVQNVLPNPDAPHPGILEWLNAPPNEDFAPRESIFKWDRDLYLFDDQTVAYQEKENRMRVDLCGRQLATLARNSKAQSFTRSHRFDKEMIPEWRERIDTRFDWEWDEATAELLKGKRLPSVFDPFEEDWLRLEPRRARRPDPMREADLLLRWAWTRRWPGDGQIIDEDWQYIVEWNEDQNCMELSTMNNGDEYIFYSIEDIEADYGTPELEPYLQDLLKIFEWYEQHPEEI